MFRTAVASLPSALAVYALVWTFSGFLCRRSCGVQGQSYLPGDASWLGDYGTGEDIPDVMEYLPYSYVIFGSGITAIARVLVSLNATTTCPTLIAEDDNMAFPIPEVSLRAEGNTALPYAFPIRVCEAYIELESHKSAWSDGRLHFDGINVTAPIKTDPQRFLLIGDTGLRSKPSDLGLGKCSSSPFLLYDVSQCPYNFTEADLNSSKDSGEFQSLGDDSWPLKTLQDLAAQEEADVIVYVGDYLYRQGPCPAASNQSCVAINGPPKFIASDLTNTSDTIANFLPGTWGDNLYGWWADLFWPAFQLFQSAPLIAVRGNHEICSRAGHGYFLFFGTNRYPENTVAGQYCIEAFEPFAVSFAQEQFLLVDDSGISPMDGGIDDYNFGTSYIINGYPINDFGATQSTILTTAVCLKQSKVLVPKHLRRAIHRCKRSRHPATTIRRNRRRKSKPTLPITRP